MKLDTFY